MARPKMTAEESAAIIAQKTVAGEVGPVSKVVVTKMQMGMPSDLLGSKLTFAQSKNLSMEATPLGVILRSKESRRKILISWGNVRAAEFQWDE